MSDAVDLERALSTAACFAAYGLAGLLFLRFSPNESQWPNTVLWITSSLVFWSLDGIVQEWQGVSLTSYPLVTGLPEGHKVTGSMGLDYGPNLAVFSPILFKKLCLRGRRLSVLWLVMPLLAVLLSAIRFSAVLLAMCPLSSALSMYSFSYGSITWPALALALGVQFKVAC